LKSKKAVLSILGIAAIVLLVVLDKDMETVRWVGGFITGIVGSFSIGQGIADAGSRGETSGTT